MAGYYICRPTLRLQCLRATHGWKNYGIGCCLCSMIFLNSSKCIFQDKVTINLRTTSPSTTTYTTLSTVELSFSNLNMHSFMISRKCLLHLLFDTVEEIFYESKKPTLCIETWRAKKYSQVTLPYLKVWDSRRSHIE